VAAEQPELHLFQSLPPGTKTIRRITKVVMEPLFPNYLFIQMNDLSNWQVLRSTREVSKVVSFNGTPAIVEDEIIHSLRIQFDKSDAQKPRAIYQTGDRVILLNSTQTIELSLAHIARA